MNNSIDNSAEHSLHYEIYYHELEIFYTKTTIFTTVELALYSGVVVEYEKIIKHPVLMASILLFLFTYSIIMVLITIRGFYVNNAVIETIHTFEDEHGFKFLDEFQSHVNEDSPLKKMNFPSFAVSIINALYLVVWLGLLSSFLGDTLLTSISIPQFSINASIATSMKCVLTALVSILLALTMKTADLLDEHGLVMFKHADVLFGFSWGLVGAILVASDNIVANAILAMMIGYVVRRRLDYINHIIAFFIIVLAFIMYGSIDRNVLVYFSVSFLILGAIKDMKYSNSSNKLSLWIRKIYLYIPIIYTIPTLVFGIYTHNWIAFFALFPFDFTYNIIRLRVRNKHWYRDNANYGL